MDVKALKLVENNIGSQVRPQRAEAPLPAERPDFGKDAKKALDPKTAKDEYAVDEGQLNELTDAMNKFMQSLNADLQFQVHDETKVLMVQLVDPKEQRVIREFPSHEFLDTMAKISESIGAFLDKKV
jgi:flagellar protein FlaG